MLEGEAGVGKTRLAVELLQGLVGYAQYFLGLPSALVVAHMAGTALFAAAVSHLLLVTRQGQPVAGNLISYAEAEPLLVVSGVRDGDRRALRDGVGGAIYHLSFRHLTEQGFTRVGLGKSRAFLRDGVLRYKKKLGMKLVGTSEGYFYLRVPHDTEASRAFLKDNPLILDDSGGLHGVVFVETNAGSLSEAQ